MSINSTRELRDAEIVASKKKPIFLGSRRVEIIESVRNMVFFKLFLCYFSQLFASFYPSTFFSLSFTLQGKDKTCAIDPMT